MAKSIQMLEAQRLRRQGTSIRSIAKQLEVSKGSVSLWCRDIGLTPTQKHSLKIAQIQAGNYGRMLGAEKNKRKRLDTIELQETQARAMVGKLTARDTYMLGIALYWGEGSKTNNSTTAITNSDPQTILFARNWFEQLGVERSMFRPYIFISETHRHRAKLVLHFWSTLLEIPPRQFANIVFLKGARKKIYQNHDSYYGVLTLRVRKGSSLKYRILGLIRACKEQAGVAQLVRASHS